MSLYLRGGNIYWCRFKFNGIRYHRSCNTADRHEALKVEQRLRAEVSGQPLPTPAPPVAPTVAQPVDPAVPTLREALDRLWEDEWKHRKDGRGQYNRVLWIAEQFGDPPLNRISTTMVEQLKRNLREQGRDVATVNRYLANLRKVLRTAKLQWEVPMEVPYFKLGKEPTGRTRVITEEEQAAMLRILRGSVDMACQGGTTMDPTLKSLTYRSQKAGSLRKRTSGKTKGNIADLVEVLVDTGMRLGEALSLTWDRVDYREKLLMLHEGMTKSARPRSIPMTDRVHTILRRRQMQGFEKPFPLKKDHVSHGWWYAKAVLGITDPEFTPHALRHTFASRLLIQGVDLYTVSKLLGHSNITVTERYSHLCVRQLREAVGKLG